MNCSASAIRLNKPGILIGQSTDVAQVLQRYGAWGDAEYC